MNTLDELIELVADRKAEIPDRIEAAKQVAEFDDAKATNALLSLLEGNGEELHNNSRELLLQTVHLKRLIAWLSDKDEAQALAAASVFKALWHEDARQPLEKLLDRENVRLRMQAAWALARHPAKESRLAFIKALNDKDDIVRLWAARALETTAEPQDAPALIHALDDEEEDVRISVGHALGHLGGANAKSALKDRIEKETSYRVVQSLKEALEK